MQQSLNVRRISINQKEQISLIDGRKLLQIRIQQTKDEITKLEDKMNYFQLENAKSNNQRLYFQDRRKFLLRNIKLLQGHLGKLIKNQAILDDDNVESSQLQEILDSVTDMNQQNLEVMKTFQTINQVPDDQPLPQDFILMSERMARNYHISISDDDLNANFNQLNNYFQNQIKQYYKTPQDCPYLKFIPKII